MPEGLTQEQYFSRARGRMDEALSFIPAELWFLKPPACPVKLLSNDGFVEEHVSDARRQGVYGGEKMDQVLFQAFSQIATYFQKPRRIIMKELPLVQQKATLGSGIGIDDFYLMTLAHEYGHGLSPYLENVGSEVAARAMCVSHEDFTRLINEYGLASEKNVYNLYGRVIEIYENQGEYADGSMRLVFKESIGNTRDKRVEEIIPDIFASYICFVDWCLENGSDPNKEESKMELLSKYRKSGYFKAKINNEEITSLSIVNAASAFGGYEELLRLLVGSQYISGDIKTKDLEESILLPGSPQREALARIVMADQAHEVIAECVQYAPSPFFMLDNYTNLDVIARFIESTFKRGKIREERLRDSAVGAKDALSHKKASINGVVDEPVALRVMREIFYRVDNQSPAQILESVLDVLKRLEKFKRRK